MTIFSSLSYLQKQRFVPRQISSPPSKNLHLVVVIPCFDEPHLLRTLNSLEACKKPLKDAEIIIIVNSGVRSPLEKRQQNQQTIQDFQHWQTQKKRKFSYHLLHFPDLPAKHAGVGLARKIGMDEAVDRLEQAQNPQGIIVCLDADSRVEENYFVEIEKFFRMNLNTEACSIFFEHPVSGEEFPPKVYDGIIKYELFLRYYVEGLRYAGYPHAYHCVGSSMAVRSMAYQKQGGMNRRKAGEDFYFLQKFIQQDTLKELFSTKVIPSPRPSEKVPFGTGRAIKNWLASEEEVYTTYHPKIFSDLKRFVRQVPALYQPEFKPDFPPSVQAFLDQESFETKLQEIRANVTSEKAFIKRFYGWFDGLKVLKYVHFARDEFYENMEIGEAAYELGKWKFKVNINKEHLNLLLFYREVVSNRNRE